MGLIDTDKIPYEPFWGPLDKKGNRELMYRTYKQWIDKMPTIEAVPFEDYRSMEQTVCKLTQALAEAEPRKHGRWLPYGEWQVECSECGFVTTALGEGHYCPRCGAKMDEVEE